MKAIEVRDLAKHFGKVKAVDGISFSVEQGEIFGFVGKNGAGKSTTIRLFLDLISPSCGSVKILGMDAQKKSKQIKQESGYVPSEVQFYDNLKVKEVLKFAAKLNGVKVDTDLCKLFELEMEKTVGSLSLGNRKKVSIVCALQKQPRVLILDEPTSGLDPVMQERLFAYLREKTKSGMTVFLSSHNLSEVEQYCDRVCAIREGKIVYTGSIEQMRKQLKKQVTMVSKSGKKLEFEYDGDINELIKLISQKNLADLSIKTQSLTQVFMEYYGENA